MFEVFPRYLQEFAVEAQVNLNMPLEYMLGSILYAGAVAIGNTHEVRIKNGWNEGTNMFMAIVGETGASKSHPISLAIKPLLKKNQEYYKKYMDELKHYEQLQKRCKKDDEVNEHIEAPKLNQLIADDATLEAIYRMHNNNPRGLGIYFDELLGWFNNMGKYNKGSDQEAWLKIWSRKPILVNRVSSLPISLMLPNISVIGSVQTKLLIELFKQNRDKNGFVERMLFIKPANTKKGEFPENDMPKSVLANYKRIIDRILDLPLHIDENAQISPILLELTNDAKELFKQHYNLNSSFINSDDTSDKIKGFYPKMDSYSARFALILQILYWACDEDDKLNVSARAMQGGIDLCEYFMDNANSVLESLKQPESLTKEHRRLLAIELYLQDTMSLREISGIIGVSHETIRKWTKEVA